MRPTRKTNFILCSLLLLLAVACAPQATPPPAATGAAVSPGAPKADWEVQWDNLVRNARNEGELYIYGAIAPETTQLVGREFYKKFGIRVNWVVGRTNEVLEKLLNEQRNNIYLADVLTDFTMSAMNYLKPRGVLRPLEPELILPDVKDTSKWFMGKLWWVDKERTHIAYSAFAMPAIVVNTDLVKKGEIQSMRDLLAPKWKGKIILDDPTVSSGGNSWLTAMGEKIMDLNFLRELAKQEPLILRNGRQEVEWVAWGKYPIGLGQSSAEIATFKRAGAPIEIITPKEGTWLSQSRGALSLLPPDKTPHPNAARLYFNWALTKEGQTLLAEGEGYQSAREDVPTDLVDVTSVRHPGIKYHDTITLEFNLKKEEYLKIGKEIFGHLLK
ncbi:MAG: extracellular solute-binding protein [Chloroflexi bacterium]|nr:extracellular solute-binding protein [Chloroflexota bacterium]